MFYLCWRSWCDRYGDVVLDVVKKEFKDHVGEMENMRNATREKHNSNSTQWTTFEDDENCHPNLFSHHDPFSSNSNSSKGFQNNPFFHDYTESNGNKLRTESAIFQDQNPFWTPRHGSSYIWWVRWKAFYICLSLFPESIAIRLRETCK